MNGNLERPELIIFDWDQTLVSSNLDLSGEDLASTLRYYTKNGGISDTIANTFTEEELMFSLPIKITGSDRRPYMNWFQNPGSHEIIEYFYKNDVPLAIVSNKNNEILRLEVKLMEWNKYFGVVVGAGDAPKKKPAPDPLLLAASKFNLSTEPKVWFIGDSRLDTQAAHGARFTPIHYRYQHDDENYHAIYKKWIARYERHHPIGDGETGAIYSIDNLIQLAVLFESTLKP